MNSSQPLAASGERRVGTIGKHHQPNRPVAEDQQRRPKAGRFQSDIA